MTGFGRIWWLDHSCRATVLTSGVLFAFGCGGSDPAAPVETAANNAPPAAAPAAEQPAAPPEQPPAPEPAASATPETPADPAVPPDSPPEDASDAAPGDAIETESAPAEMATDGSSPPDSAEASSAQSSTDKPTTGEWLSGMAAAMLKPDETTQSAPGTSGSMPPGQSGAAGEIPGEAEAIPGMDNPAGADVADEAGLAGDPAAAEEMALPGQMEGVPGEGTAGAAKAPAKEFEEGTAEYAVQQLVLKMQAGTTEGMSELINAKTKDNILAPLRDGAASPAQIDKAKELVQGIQLAGKREAGTTMMFYARNGDGKSLTFAVRRDDDSGDYRVNSLKVETPRVPGRRRR